MLIVVDVLVKVRPVTTRSRSAYELDYEALAGLHKLAVELGVAVVVVHHTRKMAAEDVIDTVSGSFGVVGAADTIIVMERRNQGCVLDVRGRDVEAVELAIAFDKHTCRWTILGVAAEVNRSAERGRILAAFVCEDGTPLTLGPREIMAATGYSDRNAIDGLLFKMVRDADLVRVGRGRYTLPLVKIVKKERFETYVTGTTRERQSLPILPISPAMCPGKIRQALYVIGRT